MEPVIRRFLLQKGITLQLSTRITDVEISGNQIKKITGKCNKEAVGDAIQYVRSQMKTEAGLGLKYTFSGSVFLDRMKLKGLYSTDTREIAQRVDKTGLTEIFSKTRIGPVSSLPC